MSEKNVFRAKLMRWGESSASGRSVTFKLPDDTEEHPFKGLPVGAKNGQLVEIEIEILEGDMPLETLDATKRKTRLPAKAQVIRDGDAPVTKTGGPRAHVIDKRAARTVTPAPTSAPAPAAPASPGSTSRKSPIPAAWTAPAMATPPSIPAPPPTSFAPPLSYAPIRPPLSTGIAAPAPFDRSPQRPAPLETAVVAGGNSSPSTASVGPAPDIGDVTSRMSEAAQALASVAERMGTQPEEEQGHNRPRFPLIDPEDDENSREPVGVRTLKRAVELCTSVDKKRAGFYYYMRALYPTVPTAEEDGAAWSRDAKVTRDRVCFHCDMPGIADLAEDAEARRRFEELEHAFERHERLR